MGSNTLLARFEFNGNIKCLNTASRIDVTNKKTFYGGRRHLGVEHYVL